MLLICSRLSIIALVFITLVTHAGISDSLDSAGIVGVLLQAAGALLLRFSNIPSHGFQYRGTKGSTGTVPLTCMRTLVYLADSNPPFHSL